MSARHAPIARDPGGPQAAIRNAAVGRVKRIADLNARIAGLHAARSVLAGEIARLEGERMEQARVWVDGEAAADAARAADRPERGKRT